MALYYVRTDGNNANTGLSDTAGGAWATFAHVVSKINDGTVQPGDTVQFAIGTYTESSNLTLSGSGTSGNPITLRAANQFGAHIQWTNDVQAARLNVSASWITFDGLHLSAPYGTNGSQNYVVRVYPDSGYGRAIRLLRCKIEGTSGFKTTALNSTSATNNWNDGTEVGWCHFITTGAGVDILNCCNTRIHDTLFEVAPNVLGGMVVIATKGGCRSVAIWNNTILNDGQAVDSAIILGGSVSPVVAGATDWVFDDTSAGKDAYYCAAWNNVVRSINGGSFWAYIQFVGAKNCAAVNNVGIGSCAGGAGATVERDPQTTAWVSVDNVIRNNIFRNVTTAVITNSDGSTGTTQSHNLTNTDPLWVNPASDWHIQAGSPALNAAMTWSPPACTSAAVASGTHDNTLDRYGGQRGTAGAWDQGVHEFGATSGSGGGGNAAITTLVDTFTDNSRDPALWDLGVLDATINTGLTVSESNERVAIATSTTATGYYGYLSVAAYDLTNAGVFVEAPQVTGAVAQAEMYLQVGNDANNKVRTVYQNGTLYFQSFAGGAVTTVATLAYNATDHRWWRIRHVSSDDTIRWDTSPDGTTWTQRATLARPWIVTGVRVNLGAGTWGVTAAGGTAIFDNVNNSDVTAPAITAGPSAGSLTPSGATITWTTDEASDSQVEYGLTTGYGSQTTLDPSLVTSHSVALSGLAASTLYHYRVTSRDAAGNRVTSSDATFTTSAAPDTTPPVITAGPAVGSLTASGAVVTWTTDEASDSQVEYGLTTAYGSTSPLQGTLVTSHSVTLASLTPGTLYHYRVLSRDAAGNLAQSSDQTFTTLAAGTTSVYRYRVPALGATYTLRLRAWDTNGNASAYGTPVSAAVSAIQQPPAPGSAPSLSARYPGVVVSYAAVPDTEAGGTIRRYQIQRAPDVSGSPGAWVMIADPDGTWYVDAYGLSVNTVYHYRYRAINTDGIPSAWSPSASVTTGQVVGADLAANSVAANHIEAGAITADKIAAGAVTSAKIEAGAITADKLAAAIILASKQISVGSGGQIDAGGGDVRMDDEGLKIIGELALVFFELGELNPTLPNRRATLDYVTGFRDRGDDGLLLRLYHDPGNIGQPEGVFYLYGPPQTIGQYQHAELRGHELQFRGGSTFATSTRQWSYRYNGVTRDDGSYAAGVTHALMHSEGGVATSAAGVSVTKALSSMNVPAGATGVLLRYSFEAGTGVHVYWHGDASVYEFGLYARGNGVGVSVTISGMVPVDTVNNCIYLRSNGGTVSGTLWVLGYTR